ncbi:MAG TPA: prepilin-type N-terminal cleavage/methylation domain-containing protein [Geobacterales bacterium]|nr:prepilin-type N-terminal cleavage/methylation domain-containing protein [Geobacterales bacterium]
MKGFTLLEVVVATAIAAGVIVTILVTFNHHLSVVTRDKEETTTLLLARGKLEELVQAGITKGEEGNFASGQPDLSWRLTLEPTQVSSVQRLVLTVRRGNKEVASLAQYRAQ